MKSRLFIMGMVCVAMASCIGTKKLTIRTDPSGADVSINGVPMSEKTPFSLEISQKKDLGIVASKPGYESAAHTLTTRTNWWLSLLWTKNDPRAQYIEEDEVTLTLKKIPTAMGYRPSAIPAYTGGGGYTTPPELRPMPADLVH